MTFDEPTTNQPTSDEPISPEPASSEPPRQVPELRRKHWIVPEDQWQVVKAIAAQLEEPERNLIAGVVRIMGLEFAQALLQETLEIEAQGGVMLPDGSRRRTPGGVFFLLAKQKMPYRERKLVFFYKAEAKTRTKQKQQKRPDYPPLEWEEREAVLTPLLDETGAASTVKVVLIGRPDQIRVRPEFVTVVITQPSGQQQMPRGVPRPDLPARYVAFVAPKQWNKVEAALADPEDILVLEGTCAYNEQLKDIAVYVTSATTRALQIQQRESQRSQSANPGQ